MLPIFFYQNHAMKIVVSRKIKEDAPANSAGGGNVAGVGVPNPDRGENFGEPGRKKNKQPLIGKRRIWVRKTNG